MRIVRYDASLINEWNELVENSRNGTFLFNRSYMDYHSDRFADHSLLFYTDKSVPCALLPGNVRQNVYHSHQGLTYGGFILSPSATIADVRELFEAAIA